MASLAALIKGRARSVSGNALATLVARGFSTFAQALAFAIVGSTFGTDALDRYVLGVTIATFASLVIDFGTGTWLTRELALKRPVSTFVLARAPLVILALAGTTVATLLGYVAPVEALAISVLSISLAVSLLAQGIFWGNFLHDREMFSSVGEVCLVLVFLTANHFGILPGHEPLLYTAAAYTLGALGRCMALPRTNRPGLGGFEIAQWWKQINSYGLQSIVSVASTQLDTILLAALWVGRPGTITAYALAMRVYYAAPMPLLAMAAALLPRFVKNPEQYKRIVIIGTISGCIVSVAMAAAFLFIAPIFGYGPVVMEELRLIMEILSISFLARCIAYVVGAFVTAQGAQRSRMWSCIFALTTMVTLDFLLIPKHGAAGAAIAMVASDWILLIGYLVSASAVRSRLLLRTSQP